MPKIKAIPDGMLMMQTLMQRDMLVPMDDVEHSIASVLSDLRYGSRFLGRHSGRVE